MRPANAAGWRLLVATLALIAFAFQSYVTQTHIHFAHVGSTSAIKLTGRLPSQPIATADKKQIGTPSNKTPSNDDPLKCPLCQAVGYAGHFVTPASAALVLALTPIAILRLAIPIVSPRQSPSHIWRGRGPPNS